MRAIASCWAGESPTQLAATAPRPAGATEADNAVDPPHPARNTLAASAPTLKFTPTHLRPSGGLITFRGSHACVRRRSASAPTDEFGVRDSSLQATLVNEQGNGGAMSKLVLSMGVSLDGLVARPAQHIDPKVKIELT